MRGLIRQKPDLTLRELKVELGKGLSVQPLCTALQRLRLTVKKSTRRRGAGTAGCRGAALWSACGDVLDRFTEAECRNYFKHCVYRYTWAGCDLAA